MAKHSDLKYLVCPGYVISRNDGDQHFITARRLIQLYGVREEECLIQRGDRTSLLGFGITREFLDSLIVLAPRYNGKYKVPEK